LANPEFRLWAWLEGITAKSAEIAQPILGSILDTELEWQNFKSAMFRLLPHPIILIRYKNGERRVAQLERIRGPSIACTSFDSSGKQAEMKAEREEIQSIVILEHAEKAVERLSEEVRKKIAHEEMKRFLEVEKTCFFPTPEACFPYMTDAESNGGVQSLPHRGW